MAGKTAILSIRIIADATKAAAGMDQASDATGRFQAGMDKAAAASGVLLGGLAAAAAGLASAAEEAGTANARIEQVADQMLGVGQAAEQVSARAIEAAESMARMTGIDPNVIKQGQATLLTFGEVAATAETMGGTFDRATALAADLSAAGFGSVESAATLLGKALNDPIKGVSALARVGVTLTEAQKEQVAAMVEAGDMASAQGVILAAVEQQVGGVAQATANGSDQMRVAWQLAQEQLGEKLLPTFTRLFEAGIQAADWVAEHSDLVLTLAGALGIVAGVIITISTAMKIYAAAQAIQTAAQWAQNAAWLANPITWIVIAIIAAIAAVIAIVWLLAENWDAVTAWCTSAWEGFVGWLGDTWENIKIGWQTVTGWLGDVWNGAVSFVVGIWERFVGFLTDAFETIKARIDAAISFVMGIFQGVRDFGRSIWDGYISGIRTLIGWIRSAVDWFNNLTSAGNRASSAGGSRRLGGRLAATGGLWEAPDWTSRAIPPVLRMVPSPHAQLAAAPSLSTLPAAATVRPTMHVRIDVHGATDPVATAREIRKQLGRLAVIEGRAQPGQVVL